MFRNMAFFFSLLLFGVMAAPNALANQDLITFKTTVPLDLPGRVIDPGRYYVIQLDSNSAAPLIEVVNSKGIALGVFQVEPVERLDPASHTILNLRKAVEYTAQDRVFRPFRLGRWLPVPLPDPGGEAKGDGKH